MVTKSLLLAALLFAPSWFASGDVPVTNIAQPEKTNNNPVILPYKSGDSLGVVVTADAAIAIDRKTGQVLFSKNLHMQLPMASTTKVMTVLLALESEKNLDDVVTVGSEVDALDGAKIHLLPGEQISFRDLIKGALISSGNDAAYETAVYASGGDIVSFVNRMNDRARELGLSDTQFKNPHGLDEEGHYTSSQDLAELFRVAVDNRDFREIISTHNSEAHAYNIDKVHYLKNTNKLLHSAYPYMKGGKTGFTDNAGFCLVSLSGHSDADEVITVVLGSDLNGNQFQDSKAIIEWVYMNYQWDEKNK